MLLSLFICACRHVILCHSIFFTVADIYSRFSVSVHYLCVAILGKQLLKPFAVVFLIKNADTGTQKCLNSFFVYIQQ